MNDLQKKGRKRNTIDKYYTKNTVVDTCLAYFISNIQVDRERDWIIEPSAGNGAFISGIKKLIHNHLFYDIDPKHPEIVKQDYLLYDPRLISQSRIHVIGNPPFGRQSSLAIQFIKKSVEFCSTLSFILPKSFKKDSLKKKFPLHFHLIFETDLPPNSFLVNENEHDVPCVFQIWEKQIIPRTITTKQIPLHFIFVSKNDNPDISFRRIGVNAGTIDTNTTHKNVQSHYFIKFTNGKPIEENLERLSRIKYPFNNTVGPNSISKQELIVEFNTCLDLD